MGRVDVIAAAMFVLASVIQFGCVGTFHRKASDGRSHLKRICHASSVTVTMLTDAEKFRAIPGEELEAVVRGGTVRFGSTTCLRRVDAGVGTLEGRQNATAAKAI